jgi:hypothetical protein
MKKTFTLLLILFFCQYGFSQSEKSKDSLTLNMLKAPSTPAFILMGLETSNIEKPTEVTDFAVILNNASKGFTTIPNNFAMQFSPISLFKKKKYTFDEITSNMIKDNFNQSLLFSLGFSKGDTAKKKNDQLGIGIKFSLFRGELSQDFTNALAERIRLSRKDNELISTIIKNTPSITSITKQITSLGEEDEEKNKSKIDSLVQLREEKINTIVEANKQKNFKKLSEISFKRYGWKADVSAGLVYDFFSQRFDTSKVTKTGVWMNFGYESKSDFSFLSVLRYLNDYDFKALKNISSLDFGVRLLQSGLIDDKLSLSIEHIWRSQLDAETNKARNSVRYVFNAEYQVSKNQLLTLSLGKNFDGSNIKDGNLIAALNFVAGFGGKR